MATSPGTTRRAPATDGARDGRSDRSETHRSSSRRRTQTKHSSKTTEFYVYIVATLGVLLAGLLTKAGDGHDNDRLVAHDTWLIVGILTVGYTISRGLAKAGSRDPCWADGASR